MFLTVHSFLSDLGKVDSSGEEEGLSLMGWSDFYRFLLEHYASIIIIINSKLRFL